MYYGRELTSSAFTEWCERHGIELRFIQPGKPDQNAFIERFNKTYRDEVLDAYVFESVEEVREITESWLHEYNEVRPTGGAYGSTRAVRRRSTAGAAQRRGHCATYAPQSRATNSGSGVALAASRPPPAALR
jgi:putative transposase